MEKKYLGISSGLFALFAVSICAAFWAHSYHHDWVDLRSTIAHETKSSGFIIAGNIDRWHLHQLGNRIYLPDQFLIMKFNSKGQTSWMKAWPTQKFYMCWATCVQEIEDDHFIVAGSRVVPGQGRFEIPVVKFGPKGSIIWQAMLWHKEFHIGAMAMTVTPDGHAIIAGYRLPITPGTKLNTDIWIAKIHSKKGSVIWQKAYDFGHKETPYSISKSSEQGFIVSGDVDMPNNKKGIFALDINGEGKIRSLKGFISLKGDMNSRSVIMLKDQTFFITGYFGTSSPASSILTINLQTQQNPCVKWAKTFDIFPKGIKGLSYGESVCQTDDDDLVIAGSSTTGVFSYPPKTAHRGITEDSCG